MDTLAAKISSTLGQLRRQNGWSLDVTSKNTGVSKAMLGQIERGESSPTISTLWKIASGFNVPFSSFIVEVNANQPEVIHQKPEQQKMHEQDDKINIASVFPFDQALGFEAFMIELLPGCVHLSPPHQHGVIEHVIAVKGAVEIMVNDVWHFVHSFEGLRFEAHLPHGYRNLTDQPVLFHNMIHYR